MQLHWKRNDIFDRSIAGEFTVVGWHQDGTRATTLKVVPVEGFTPDPGQVKVHCRRGKKGHTAPGWDGVEIANPNPA